jgi:hypothetical protein
MNIVSATTPAGETEPAPRSAGVAVGSVREASISEKRTPERLKAGVFTLEMLLAIVSSARCCASSPIAAMWNAPLICPPDRMS